MNCINLQDAFRFTHIQYNNVIGKMIFLEILSLASMIFLMCDRLLWVAQ